MELGAPRRQGCLAPGSIATDAPRASSASGQKPCADATAALQVADTLKHFDGAGTEEYEQQLAAEREALARQEQASPPPPLRTNRTRRVLHPVLIGHAASFTPY